MAGARHAKQMKASEHQKGTEDCAEVPFATKIPNKGKENSTYFLFGEKKKINHRCKTKLEREKVVEKAVVSQSCWEFAAGLDHLQPLVLLHGKGSKAHLNIPEGLCS